MFWSVGRDMNIQHLPSISAPNATWPKTNLPITRTNHFAAILAWNFSVSVKTLYSDNNWVIKVWTPLAVPSQNRSLLIIWISSSLSPPAKLVFFVFFQAPETTKKHPQTTFILSTLNANFPLTVSEAIFKTHIKMWHWDFNLYQYHNFTLKDRYCDTLFYMFECFAIQFYLLLPLECRQNVKIDDWKRI